MKNFSRIFGVFGVFITLLGGASASARPLQIIHTNDIHSHFEKGNHDDTGGLAAIKGVIESLKAQAASQGIESVVLDAGDFTEGTAFFLADDGKQSWRTMDAMGYDAITLGNHDWLIGAKQMDEIVGAIQPRTPFLAANMILDESLTELRRYVHPYVQFKRAGLRIAVLGLTTDEFLYKWRLKEGDITYPYDVAREEMLDLRNRNDLVIVLSHLGYEQDRKLARTLWGTDLIVGGHSHTRLDQPVIIKGPFSKRKVPIVQTGEHGEFVGDLRVDVEPGRPMKVLSYQLVPVNLASPRDPGILERVQETRRLLEHKFSADWLYRVIGESEVPLERPLTGPTVWGQLAADAMREAAGADFALDIGEFFGVTQNAGLITHETLMQFYPRVFDAKKTTGWNIWMVKVPGWLLRLVLDEVAKSGQYMVTSGLSFAAGEIHVAGQAIDDNRNYRVAVSEGVGRGAYEISFLLRKIFRPRDTGVPIWSAMEEKLAAMGGRITREERAPASLGLLP